MPKALASRATFLPMVPSPTMPSTLPRISKMPAWEGALPRQRPATTELCCQTRRRQTACISMMACSDTAVALAPPLLQTGTLAARAASMSTVS